MTHSLVLLALAFSFLLNSSAKTWIFLDKPTAPPDWNGPSVYSYTRVYCAPSPNNTNIQVVAGIDLNHADIAGFLAALLSELPCFMSIATVFVASYLKSLANLTQLSELDLSNNRFPSVVLSLHSLRFLDIRFNEFEGPLPPQLFSMNLDVFSSPLH